MPSILTTATLTCKDPQARQQVISAFKNIIAYTAPHEPEVLQYVCALLESDATDTKIYMIEEYANQAASDAHMGTQPVKDLIQLFSTSDVLVEPPEVHNSTVLVRKTINPVTTSAVSDSRVLVLELSALDAGTSARSPEDVDAVVEKVRSKVQGLRSLVVAEDQATKSIRIECALEGGGALMSFPELVLDDEARPVHAVKIIPKHGFLSRARKSKL